MAVYSRNVFVNCPFDAEYEPLFRAILFSILDCGFDPHCALELDDSSQSRIDKIYTIISNCRFGIHDLSRTDLDADTALPRFNMPLELGIFLGAKRFGTDQQKKKNGLILDIERYRFQRFISDISGQDIKAHGGDANAAITLVRDWLATSSRRTTLPGRAHIQTRYATYTRELPGICAEMRLDPTELIYQDRLRAMSTWLTLSGNEVV